MISEFISSSSHFDWDTDFKKGRKGPFQVNNRKIEVVDVLAYREGRQGNVISIGLFKIGKNIYKATQFVEYSFDEVPLNVQHYK